MRSALYLVPLALIALVGCNGGETPKTDDHGHSHDTPATDGAPKDGAPKGGTQAPLTKLLIEDIKVGTGDPVKAGDQITVRYEGKLADGTPFDGNIDNGKPAFTLEAGPNGTVIEGWKQGLLGMKVGGERKLSIPWALAYGEEGRDKIPPKSDLFFTVRLESVVAKEKQNEVERKLLKAGTGAAVRAGQSAIITFVGKLADGTTIDEGKNYTFKVGAGDVIPGIDAGVIGMKVGGQYRLTIPPSLAFGPIGREPAVPANAVLTYDITVNGVK